MPILRALLVRGTFLRIAELRSKPAHISLAASPPAPPRRMVEPSPGRHLWWQGPRRTRPPTLTTQGPRRLLEKVGPMSLLVQRAQKELRKLRAALLDRAVPHQLSAHNRLDLGKSQKQRRLREALAGLQLPFPRRLDDLRLGHGSSDSNKGPVCPRFGPIPFVGPIQLLLQDYCSGQVA
jgi:hypothetical protein